MRFRTSFLCLFFIATFFASYSVHAQSANTQQTLNQYISDLQKNPNDNALREKIIKHVQTMKQKPAVPEEARRHFVKAVTMQKEAKDIRGFELAANAYSQALLIAPWWADAYYNRGLALESSNQYDEAVRALKFYLLTNPGNSELRAAQDKIYALEAKKEMAQVKETAPAEKPKADLDVSGRWRTIELPCSAYMYAEYRLEDYKLYHTTVYEDKTITNPNCPSVLSKYRDQKIEQQSWIRSGKNKFRRSTSATAEELEFIGDKAFYSIIDLGDSNNRGSFIYMRER